MLDPKCRYVIEVSADQAYLLRDACELLARCRMGQIRAACEEVLNAQGKAVVPYDLASQVEKLVKAAVGLEQNQSWGVGKHESADMAFELYCALRHRLAWDHARKHQLTHPDGSRNWKKMMGVDYDIPLTYTTHPPAKVAQLETPDQSYPFVVGQPDEGLAA
jgi:hypothetical protein